MLHTGVVVQAAETIVNPQFQLKHSGSPRHPIESYSAGYAPIKVVVNCFVLVR